jgi:AraC-like DNA-binding protein
MAARLRPWSVGELLANCPDFPRRDWRDAAGISGRRLALVAEMVGRRDWDSLCGAFDQVLVERMSRRTPGEAGIDWVGPFLDDGRRSVAMVAGERDTTRRQVERRVRSLTGTSPKQLAGRSRFQKVRDAIWADPSVDLARLAFDAGYADQPHMTREFRRYSGQTPARFARESMARKAWLAARDVAFVQERPAPDG